MNAVEFPSERHHETNSARYDNHESNSRSSQVEQCCHGYTKAISVN